MAKSKPAKTARAAAAQVIGQVCQQHHALNGTLSQAQQHLPEKERALCQQLCYGVLRWQSQLSAITKQLVTKPLKAKDSDINALLLIGLYQLRDMRLPEHAVLSETVNACQQLNKPWAKGLVNAVLRQYQRQLTEFEDIIAKTEQSQFAHPKWLIDQIKQDWPEQWQTALEANNKQPPMFIRVNQQHHSQSEYLALLQQEEITASAVESCPSALLLAKPIDVFQLPGFAEGHVSVQDAAGQLVQKALDIKPNQRILDACAAPGGKTGHILETEPCNDVFALDIDQDRLQLIKQNTDRLGLNATLITADAADTHEWWDGKPFDRILIDAPCSGTGVIRRHPDIKQLRRESDIAQLAATQLNLLESLWPLLNTNGLLVYTTCSILKQENEQQIMAFLSKHADAEEIELEPMPATRQSAGYQRLPGQDNMDGFYYACLRRC